MTTTIQQVARAIAQGLGDCFDHAFASKGDWNAARGESGGRFRDINEPMQPDYLESARAALKVLREPTPEMLRSVDDEAEDPMVARGRAYSAWQAMINTALGQGSNP